MPGRSSFLRQMTALTMLLASVGIGVQFALAEQPQTEEVTLPLGSVFEILAQEGTPGTQYAWVLSLDRTFLQAGRGRVLRTRFSQPGKYFLSAEVTPARLPDGQAGGKSIRRSFAITVKEDLTADAPAVTVTTVPPHVSGMIALRETQRLVKIIPPPGALTALMLDADVNSDEDGDGIADNDPSSADTFLGSDGLPLFLWITGEPPKTFALTGQQQDGTPFSQQFTASVGEGVPVPAPGEEPAPVTGGIEYTEREDGTVHLKIKEAIPTTTPVLPLWDFGDGTQSLLLEPLHSYGSSGTYIVRVRLKDLRNGIDIRDLRQSILVKGAAAPSSPETPIPPEKDPKPDPSSGRTSRILVLVLKIVIGLVFAGLIGAAATFAFAKLRKGKSLADRLEEADKKMVIGKEGVLDGAAVAPMSLPEIIDEAPKRPAPAKPAAPAPAASPAPVLSDASMPDWLSPAGKKPEPTAPVPAPKALPPAPTPAAAPKTEAAPKEMPKPAPAPVSSPDGPLPAWLQSNPAPATPAPPKAPAPAAAPAPVPVTPPPPATPPPAPATPKPAPAPAPKPALPPAPTPAPAAPAAISFAAAPDTKPQPAPASPAPKPEAAAAPQKHDGALPTWLQPTSPKEPEAPKPVAAPAPSIPRETASVPPPAMPAPAPAPLIAAPAPKPAPVVSATPAPAAPPAASLPKEPAAPTPAPAAPVSAPIPAPAPKPAPIVPAIPVAPTKPAAVPPAEKIPDNPPSPAPVKASPAPTVSSTPKTPDVPPVKNVETKPTAPVPSVLSDKERERRRLKRQRYRQNKAKREAETSQTSPATQPPAANEKPQRPDDAPVAFIRAESIEKKPEPNKPTKPTEPNPPPQESK